jgi:3-oxoadipate enol-lactonase
MNPWTTERIGPAPFLAVDHTGSGELLVFLHGIGGNRTNWHDQLPAFGEHFHAVAWDARGYGGSDDYEGPLTFSDYTHDLARVLDHFGARKAHIVGLSMGGRIAMDFAEKYPDRLLTLTLCDTHRGVAHFSDEKRREFLRLRKEPLIKGGQPKDIAVPVAKTLIGPKASPEAFQRLVDSLTALHKESYMKSLDATVLSDSHDRLGDIRVPTHVVVGGGDRLTTPEMAQDLVSLIPDATLTVIPEAGHLCNIEEPELFNEAVIGFILEARERIAR